MTDLAYGADVNLKELRSQLTGRIAWLMIAASGLVMWRNLYVFWMPFPSSLFLLSVAVLILGLGAKVILKHRPALAWHLVVWGLTAGLIVGMMAFEDPWLPFMGLMLVFVGGMLVRAGGFLTAGAVAAAAIWLVGNEVRSYPLSSLLLALLVGVALAWLVVHTLYTALAWSWTTQRRADRLLELSRDRQEQVNRTLKSLNLSNSLLSRTKQELIAARRQAEEARLTKEQFAANVSHELRTPLNLVLGFSELIYLSPEIYGELRWPPKLRRAVYQIYRSSRHLSEMIDDVLELSRFEMVGFTLNKEPTSLEPLLQEVVGIASDLFHGRPVHLQMDIVSDLPTLEIDRTRIRQVLLNLLSNAARFTDEGAVRIKAWRADGEVVVGVSDTGPGIPADKASHIFEEFYQADTSLRRRHGGTGLGLAISKRFVEAHDGRIWVETEEGQGSTFFFSMPIPGEFVPLSRLEAQRPLEGSRPSAQLPVLIVDPDPAVAALLERQLESHPVVQVDDPGRLEAELELHHPLAVVWNLPPGQDDERDLSHLPTLPVPLIACSLPSRTWLAADLDVAACLTKPVKAASLLHEVERLGEIADVLIIDDERGFCQLVEQMLEAAGQSIIVRHAYDGAEGLAAMRIQRPELLLLDVMIPGVDGLQVLDIMQRDPALAQVPVILLTSGTYVDGVLGQGGEWLVVQQAGGLKATEVLQCVRAAIEAVEPRYETWLNPA